ncbi:MAG: hypothetical protein IPM24_28420 [Bryobacterales bacterium]|nr:hypothetical protein [Bryobacterales bacterium]
MEDFQPQTAHQQTVTRYARQLWLSQHENEPISSAEPEPPGAEAPARTPEIAKTNPIAEESSPRPATCTRCHNTRRRAPRLTPRLKAFLEIRRTMRRAA